MIRLAANTMATPELSVQEAVQLFAELGLVGIDLVCDEASGVTFDLDVSQRRALRGLIEGAGLRTVCLRPYMWDINSADPTTRRTHLDGLKRYVDLAVDLGSPIVRAYGGREVPPDRWDAHWPLLVEALAEAADYAAASGVVIGLENHHGTMTDSAERTMRAIQAAARPNLRIIYDQANLSALGYEPWRVALPLQRAQIIHVDLKDFDFTADGKKRARVLGEGIVPWAEILPALAAGYDGFLSLEYERKWRPRELPEARVGLRRCLEYVAGHLQGQSTH